MKPLLNPLDSETLVKEYSYLSMTLTSQRLIYNNIKQDRKVVIPLQELKSCKMKRKNNYFLGSFAILSFVAMELMLFMGKINLVPFLMLAGVGFTIGYFFTRKIVLMISSDSEKIVIDIQRIKKGKIKNFIHAVKKAKKHLAHPELRVKVAG